MPGTIRRGALLAAALSAGLAMRPALAQHPPPAPGSDDATTHHSFKNVDQWVRVFDDPSRDAWQKPREVAAALALKPGMIVADIGAGTGYFNRHLSRAVSPGGIVLAIDTEPEMVQHMGVRAISEKTANVVPVLCAPEDPFLPPGRVDRVIVVDTYHHIDDRRAYFGRMRASLAPGGRLAILDFQKRPTPVGPPVEHRVDRDVVVRELGQAGWSLAEEKTFLPYQYFLLFTPAPGGAR